MAFRTTCLVTVDLLVLAAGLLAVEGFAAAQQAMPLQRAQARTGPDLTPALEGATLTVEGTLTTPPVWAVDGYLLGLRDETGYGLAIFGGLSDFAGLAPGDRVVATGKLTRRAGMPVLVQSAIVKTGPGNAPAPLKVKLADLSSTRYLGLAVVTEGNISRAGSTDTDDYLYLGSAGDTIKVVLPKTRNDVVGNMMGRFNRGDRVRVTGLAIQQCPLPPFDRSFQILAWEPKPVVLVRRALILLMPLIGAVAGLLLILTFWWFRGRRIVARRKTMRSLNALGEDMASAASPGEILKRLAAAIAGVSRATGVRLYVHNASSLCLDRVQSPGQADSLTVALDSPAGSLESCAALAFRTRRIVNIADTRRSPHVQATGRSGLPRSAMFVPMVAQGEPLGVLEIDHDGGCHFTDEEQAAAQHLANQVATSLRSQQQRSVREHLHRGEKLSAAGQLISGIASELKYPLQTILGVSNRLLARAADTGMHPELRMLSGEALRASEIVARLDSFGRAEEGEPRHVELNALISSLARCRERERDNLNIVLQNHLTRDPLYTIGSPAQLEQVFQEVLVHVERCAAESDEKRVSVGSIAAGDRAVIQVDYDCAEDFWDPFDASVEDAPGGLGIQMLRGILQTHGGDVKLARMRPQMCRIEVELPLCSPAGGKDGSPRTAGGRAFTTLVIEPDVARRLGSLKNLSARGHRVVPVSSAEEGIDLVLRMHFDVALCPARLAGLSWTEFIERARGCVSAFVQTGGGLELDAGKRLPRGDVFVVGPSGDPGEFERVISHAEAFVEQRDQADHAHAG